MPVVDTAEMVQVTNAIKVLMVSGIMMLFP